MRLPFNTQSLPQNALAASVWLFVLALSAWLAAGWYWRMQAAPRQSAVVSSISDPAAAAQDIAGRQLFGITPAIPASAAAAPPPSLVVIGVQTRWGKLPGFAVVRDANGPSRSYVEGEEISAGVKLVRVKADGIEIERNGTREDIPLNTSTRSGFEMAPQTAINPPSVPSGPASE